MRSTLLLSALAVASVAHGQTTVVNGPEAMVREAYENQRQNDALVLEMRGTDTQSGASATIHAVLYWRLSLDPRTNLTSLAQTEFDVFDVDAKGNDVPRMRLVGDGVSLYRYDLVRREVSTTTYGFFGPTVPQAYVLGSDAPRLLAQLRTATPGLATYLVRFLDELNPTGPKDNDPNLLVNGHPDRYLDWLPGRANLAFDQVPMPLRQMSTVREADFVNDPITGRSYVRGDNEWMFSGMDRTNTDRTVAFCMVDQNNHVEGTYPRWVVGSVSVAQRTAVRTVDLTLGPSARVLPAGAFAPFTGPQAAVFRPIAARS